MLNFVIYGNVLIIYDRWGGGDKFFASISKNLISVYDTETFSLIDEKSLRVECVADFSWSPTDFIISLFVPELRGEAQPARVRSTFFHCCTLFCSL